MAIERNWTGFEGGASDACALHPFIGGVIGEGDGLARSGEFFCRHLSGGPAQLNVGQPFRRKTTTLGTGLATGEQVKVAFRVWLRLIEHVGTTNCRACGIGNDSADPRVDGYCCLNTAGQFAAVLNNVVSAYSTAALALGTWYRIDLTYLMTQNAGTSSTIDLTVEVYTEEGALLGTATRSVTNALNASLPLEFNIGNGTIFRTSTFHFDFDDWFWEAGDKADAGSVAFPSATRVFRVSPTAQGASADWTGDYRRVIDIPREANVTDEQTTSTDEASTTFAHASAASLGLGAIEGIVVRAALKASGGTGVDALLLNGVEYAVTTPMSYPGGTASLVPDGVDFTPYTAAQFDAMEFGARNKRGVATQLGNCYLEVLHDGTDPGRAPFTTGTPSTSFRITVAPFTGTGTYQTLTGVGFGSQVILIKPANSTANVPGILKLARGGGTLSRRLGGNPDAIAVMRITADGFELGPSSHANAAGVAYEAVCMQDGGACAEHFLSSGVYLGSAIDNRDVVQQEVFQPDLVFGVSGNVAVLRTAEMSGDLTLRLDAAVGQANVIQALLATGFQIGSDALMNSLGSYAAWFSLRQGPLGQRFTAIGQRFIATGKVTPTGSSFSVEDLPFSPAWVLAKRNSAAAGAFWRATHTHAGANSTPWIGGADFTTAIVALANDGFDAGALLATAGVDTYWAALVVGEVVLVCLPPPCVIAFPLGESTGDPACDAPAPSAVLAEGTILQEDDFYLLQEDGFRLLLDAVGLVAEASCLVPEPSIIIGGSVCSAVDPSPGLALGSPCPVTEPSPTTDGGSACPI